MVQVFSCNYYFHIFYIAILISGLTMPYYNEDSWKKKKEHFKHDNICRNSFTGNGRGDPPGLLADDLLNPIQSLWCKLFYSLSLTGLFYYGL